MQKYDCEEFYLTFFPFWEKLCESDKELLCSGTAKVMYQKGQNIHGGNECTGVIIPKTGSLRVYLLSDEGREVTLYRLFPGDFCMLSASCVLKAITFDVFVDAEEDSECYLVNGKVFSDISERNLYMKNFALEAAVGRFSDVMWVMQQILFMSLDKRLAIFLWDEISASGDVNIKMTHEQIAKYTGSAREVISRMLKYFASEGIIESSRGGIRILDKQKLRDLTVK